MIDLRELLDTTSARLMAMYYLDTSRRRRVYISLEQWEALSPLVLDAVLDVATQFEAWVTVDLNNDASACTLTFSDTVPESIRGEVERDLHRLCELRLTRRLSEDMFNLDDVRLRYQEDALLDSLLTLLL